MDMSKHTVFARRPFDYAGKSLDRGQVFELTGQINDEKLLRLGYCAQMEAKTDLYKCDHCGAEFVDIGARGGHVKDRHRASYLTPEEEDEQIDRREKMLNETAPLYLDKTLASQNG